MKKKKVLNPRMQGWFSTGNLSIYYNILYYIKEIKAWASSITSTDAENASDKIKNPTQKTKTFLAKQKMTIRNLQQTPYSMAKH